MDWSGYVRSIVGRDSQAEISRKTGINPATISRWLNQDGDAPRITTQSVRLLASAYGRDVVEAFVFVGFLSAEEAGRRYSADLRVTPTRDLVAELLKPARLREVSRVMTWVASAPIGAAEGEPVVDDTPGQQRTSA